MAKADALAPDATLQAVEAAKQVLNGGSDDARVLSAATGLLDGALRAARSRADAHAKAKNEDEDALKGPNAVATAVLKAAAAPKALQAVWRVLTYESPRIEHATDSDGDSDDDGRGSRELASCTVGWRAAGRAALRVIGRAAAPVDALGGAGAVDRRAPDGGEIMEAPDRPTVPGGGANELSPGGVVAGLGCVKAMLDAAPARDRPALISENNGALARASARRAARRLI